MIAIPEFQVRDLGAGVAYAEALTLQRELVAARQAGEIPDTLVIVEHAPVITLGRRRTASANVVAAGDTPVVAVERGGDVTWHGPGQLVGYPIFQLGPAERDLHLVLRRLEDALIGVLGRFGLEGVRKPGYTGVWCQGLKLVSLGVAVSRWVTYHGFALNVAPDLAQFQRINPCGLSSEVMGSMVALGVPRPPRAMLVRAVAAQIGLAFGRAVRSPPG